MRTLGRTGIKVSEFSLGCMTFGPSRLWPGVACVGQKAASRLARMAIDSGINCFDTADMYSYGESERLLGRALRGKRAQVLVCTKVFNAPDGAGPNETGLSRHHILSAADLSLKRLGTDWIDIYYAHIWDHATPIEETLKAFDDLVRWGKVRYVGCSNFSGWQIAKSLGVSERLRLERFACLQAKYNLACREVENELLPVCREEGLGYIVWGPLAKGYFSGKYRPGQPRPAACRLSRADEEFLRYEREQGHAVVAALDKIAQARRATPSQIALAWLQAKTAVTSVILGVRSPEQLQENLSSAKIQLTAEELAVLDDLSRPPSLYPYEMIERNNRRRLQAA